MPANQLQSLPPPSRNDLNEPHLPPRFEECVIGHVVRVCCHEPKPSVLVVVGLPGNGKTFQCTEALSRNGILHEVFSASRLSGATEGDSIAELKSTYATFGERDQLSAIVIDDFDMSISDVRAGYVPTPNAKVLTSFLMHVVESPERVYGRRSVRHVPLILTGNNFADMYAPLLRHGRCTFFEWVPTDEERHAIVGKMFQKAGVDEALLKALLRAHPEEPISFFSDLFSMLYGRKINQVVDNLKGQLDGHRLGEVRRSDLEATFKSTLSRLGSVEGREISAAAKTLAGAKRLRPK